MTTVSVGSKLGRYTIESELGKGGMSVVYRARDPQLERVVAIKVMHDFLATNADARKRFHREAIAVAKLEHPNIIKVLDFPDEDVTPLYIVMEYVDGKPLSDVLDLGQPLGPPELSLMLGRALCDALAHAHAAGVIHRDLKPENVLVGKDGTLKLTDFGIARLADTQSMTMTGTLLGSPAFMAPEYIEGRPTDHRVDIFAFGAMLYQLTTGQLPFTGDTPATLLHAIAKGEYPAPAQQNPSIHSGIGRIIDTCIAHSPDERYGDANGAVEAIDMFLSAVEIDATSQDDLKAALSAPAQAGKEMERTLTGTYINLAKSAIGDGDHGAGLEHLDRVMSLSPENEEVHRILDQLQRNQKARKVVQGVGLFIGFIVLLFVISSLVAQIPRSEPGPKPDPEPVVGLNEDPTPPVVISPSKRNITFLLDGEGPLFIDGLEQALTGDGKSYSLELLPGPHLARFGPPGREMTHDFEVPKSGAMKAVPLKSVRPPIVAPRPSVPAAVTPKPKVISKRDVSLTALGNWVNVEVDGSLQAKGKMGKFSLSLTEGEHTLRFTHDFSVPMEMSLIVGPEGTKPPGPILVKLEPHPAKLFWGAFPDGAILTVYDGRSVGKPHLMNKLMREEPVMVSLEPGQGVLKKRVKVVSDSGDTLFDGPVEFRAGQPSQLRPGASVP